MHHGATLKDEIAQVRDLVILVAILLFAAGWLVSFFYLQNFGISLIELSWPPQAYYLYSIIPFRYAIAHAWPFDWRVSWPAYAAIGIVAMVLVLSRVAPTLRVLWIGLGLLAGVAWLYPVSFVAAQDEAQCTRRGGGNLSTYLLVDWDQIPTKDRRAALEVAALKDAIAQNSAVIVAHTESALYVLYQPDLIQARASGQYGRAPIFRLPLDAVRLARSSTGQLPNTRSVPWGGSCNA